MIVVILGFVYCILHVCGGDPVINFMDFARKMVFSTCVEVILIFRQYSRVSERILHVCGGDPNDIPDQLRKYKYSPRMWR